MGGCDEEHERRYIIVFEQKDHNLSGTFEYINARRREFTFDDFKQAQEQISCMVVSNNSPVVILNVIKLPIY